MSSFDGDDVFVAGTGLEVASVVKALVRFDCVSLMIFPPPRPAVGLVRSEFFCSLGREEFGIGGYLGNATFLIVVLVVCVVVGSICRGAETVLLEFVVWVSSSSDCIGP
jgi:hypothetical protein